MPKSDLEETFYERFRRVLSEHGLRVEQAATIMEASADTVRRLADGRTKQIKLDEALRLCDRFGIDPWYLAFGRERAATSPPSSRGEDPLRRLEERVDRLSEMVRDMAAARAVRAEAEGETTSPPRRRSAGTR